MANESERPTSKDAVESAGQATATPESLLRPLRDQIDAVDAQLVDLVAQRFALVARVAEVKAAHGMPVVVPERFKAVLARAEERAAARGLAPKVIRRLYEAMHDEACEMETSLIARRQEGDAGD
ncbi:MAG TPA: chorismate mutase [Alphaproteobacteria bacterium]